jgi:hypothetical protein
VFRITYHSFKWRIRLDGIFKGAFDGDILNNREIELVFADVGVCFFDFVGLFLASNGSDYGMPIVY